MQIEFLPSDLEGLNRDWDIFLGPQAVTALILCTYDVKQGHWRYHKIKPNVTGAAGAAGSAPDDISTVFDMLTALGENILKDELLQRIPIKHPEQDDWLKTCNQSQW